jgi:hypothetical protein
MPIVVKPISANLTNDQDNFGKMVLSLLFRIPIVSSLSETISKELRLILVEDANLAGAILLSLIIKKLS